MPIYNTPFVTKMPVHTNFDPTPEEMVVRLAVHALQDACEDRVILMRHSDELNEVYLMPSILPDTEPTEYGDKTVDRPAGTVEHQVSDGPISDRSIYLDFYNLKEAIECFNEVVALGWKGYADKHNVKQGLQ